MEPSRLRQSKQVLRFVKENDEFESRLAEESDGDREFLQWGVPRQLSLTEEDLIGALNELAAEGLLEATSTVHSDDSSEYIFKWSITPEGRKALDHV